MRRLLSAEGRWLVMILGLILLIGGAVTLGVMALAACVAAGRLDGPDTNQRDPYGVAGRDSDAPILDLAQAVGVADAADGAHDDLLDVTAERWAAEVAWLTAAYEGGGELPVVPGRDGGA